MNAPQRAAQLVIGQAMLGGFFAGTFNLDGIEHGIIVSPASFGEFKDVQYLADEDKKVEGALSYYDGLANTNAMAEAGSEIAKQVRALINCDGQNDWYIPSQDELEIIYRNLKPTTNENWLYNRSGINLSALPPTRPYTATNPLQTTVEAFKEGNDEAFSKAAYWSSTQHAAYAGYAWFQDFNDGDQDDYLKDSKLCVRAVRRFVI